jgi:KDO2-lipid IV(A) lauroyltransferase
VEILRRNEVLALLCDGDLFRRGVEVPFCGRRVRLPAGPARLAARTGAALVPAYCLRDPAGGLVARFLPEVPVTATTEEAVRIATEKLAERLGRVVATHPGQWLIFRDFFRNGNDGRLAVLGDAA